MMGNAHASSVWPLWTQAQRKYKLQHRKKNEPRVVLKHRLRNQVRMLHAFVVLMLMLLGITAWSYLLWNRNEKYSLLNKVFHKYINWVVIYPKMLYVVHWGKERWQDCAKHFKWLVESRWGVVTLLFGRDEKYWTMSSFLSLKKVFAVYFISFSPFSTYAGAISYPESSGFLVSRWSPGETLVYLEKIDFFFDWLFTDCSL